MRNHISLRKESRRRILIKKLHREILPRFVGNADGRIEQLPAVFLPGIEDVAPLHRAQRHRVVRFHRNPHRLAGVRRKAAGDVHGNHRPRRFIDEANHRRLFPFHMAGEAGADERIHQDVGFVNVRNPIRCLLDGDDRAVHFFQNAPVALGRLAHVGFIAHEEHHHLRAPSRRMAGNNEAVASIISAAAKNHHESAVPGHIVRRQRHHRSAGILHQNHFRKPVVLHGALVQGSGLLCRRQYHFCLPMTTTVMAKSSSCEIEIAISPIPSASALFAKVPCK